MGIPKVFLLPSNYTKVFTSEFKVILLKNTTIFLGGGGGGGGRGI